MIYLIKFNYNRIFTSKFFIFSTLFTFLSSLMLYVIWVVKDSNLYLNWISLAVWIIYIASMSVYFISNIMISDVKNGIFSLEVRKGVDYKSAMWVKLMVVKSIIWLTILLAMLLFYIVVIIIKPLKVQAYMDGFIPGYAALFALDFLFTGTCLLCGSFIKLKPLLAINSFLIGVFIFSPLIGTFHTAFLHKNYKYGVYVSSSSEHLTGLRLQKYADENKEGLVSFFFNEITTFNDPENLVIKRKGNILDHSFDYILEEKNFRMFYFLSIGQPLEIEETLNADKEMNAVFDFSLTEKFKNSKIINFFNKTILINEENNFEESIFEGFDIKNLTGKNQLFDYLDFLSSTEMVQLLEKEFNFKDVKKDLNFIKDLAWDFWLWEKMFVGPDYRGDYIVNVNSGTSGVYPSVWGTARYYSFSSLTDYKIRDGNQLFIILMSYWIYKNGRVKPNTGKNVVEGSAYDLIYNDEDKKSKLFLVNPIFSFPYMTLFTKTSSNIFVSEFLSDTLMPFTYMHDLALYENENAIVKETKLFIERDNLPVKYFENTKLVIDVWKFYLAYIVIAFILALPTHFIYIKRVRP
ncbi:hypothetical protein SCHIN_v1c03710 [Spiroplasma chinense]|uniref:Uncharacterized protein n=1 Tax=Spiroplasma chinense TaxID=216932 RepID=A0A5B9Y385_9MOLU|nr:hypothetical protein [Spiroplasma chinense]QEH61568.1 hypothetical protein SCHIN_v1c03710 [Spiroplasma chinense]